MATPSSATASVATELDTAWAAYRVWSCTSKYQKQIMDGLTNGGLWLAIVGSFAAPLSEQLKSLNFLPQTARPIEIIAAAAVAVAAYLGQQAQANSRVSHWTRARSAAETIKSGIFLYRAGAQPFAGTDRAVRMQQYLEKILSDMQGIDPRQPAPEKERPDLGPLKVSEYITKRVQDQIDWYERRTFEFQKKADFFGGVSALLTVAALLLTACAVYFPGFSRWAPVIGTAAASLTAHLKSQQYQMLKSIYSSTAMRLRMIRDEWSNGGKTDDDRAERGSFIQRCEEAMSNENGSWSGLWRQKS